ncbi:MAG TPA: NAD(P)H-dependent oxidoreductase subunit E [Candidatus Acidoferrales bacterium]|nr:NAD(P)H-dependent oxidoreductase subunit E [Candidatus Acidoferrales bacterium]
MDLHLTGARATPDEQAAVNAILGKPGSGWGGGARRIEDDGRAAYGGQESRSSRRNLLLPALHAIQRSIGWISPGALNYVSVRLDIPPAEAYGVASFYGMFSLSPRPPVVAHVCDDIACMTRGAAEVCGEIEKKLGPAGSPCLGGRAMWLKSACLGLCERAPAAMVTVAGARPRERVLAPADPGALQSLISDAVNGKLPAEPDALSAKSSVPQAGQPGLRLLRRVAQSDPSKLDDYRRAGGFEALRKALDLGPEGVVREIIESRLLGRGGAAFPTGKKWEALLTQRTKGRTHYVVCNADESEPGTFKDRIVMEGDPFAVLEGMTIAALATGSQYGYIYLRGEYPLAAEALGRAIRAARAGGVLGENILGRGLRFDIELRRGAGAYICGEETALFNSIEGFRGEPRNKPPFPTQAGLFRQPTVVNNVETLINVLEIMLVGGAAYSRIGTADSSGYRLFCVSGHVVRPGIYEVTHGATLRDVISLAGGVGGNGRLQAVLLGGAAGAFVAPKELDTPLTFDGTRKIGATLGSGVILLFDDSVDLKRILLRIAAFFKHETCGQCVPCRVGVVRQQETLERLTSGRPLGSAASEVELLREMGQAMRDASICGLGQTASSAIESALNRWSLFS